MTDQTIYLHRKNGKPLWRFKFHKSFTVHRGVWGITLLRNEWIYKSNYGNVYILHTEHRLFGEFQVLRFNKEQCFWFSAESRVQPLSLEFPNGAVYFWKWPELRECQRFEQSRGKLND